MATGTRMPPQLVQFWVDGEGAAGIRCEQPGDFARCRLQINEPIVRGETDVN